MQEPIDPAAKKKKKSHKKSKSSQDKEDGGEKKKRRVRKKVNPEAAEEESLKKRQVKVKAKEEVDPFVEPARKYSERTDQGGAWSPEEHCRYVEAIRLYGKEWNKVREYIGTNKTNQAIRNRTTNIVRFIERNMSTCDYADILPILKYKPSITYMTAYTPSQPPQPQMSP